METPLGKVYNKLIYLKKIKNQTEFGNALGYNKGYVSTLLRQASPLKSEVKMRLKNGLGISIEWLENGAESGVDMFGNPTTGEPIDVKTPQNQGINTMLHDLIKAQQDHGIAANDQAAAMLILAKSNLMLTEIIQRNLGESFLKKGSCIIPLPYQSTDPLSNKPPKRLPDVEYLTLSETERIMGALNKGEFDFNPAMRAVAAYFLVECYSGIRFSDWGRFSVETMSQARYLKVRAKKNGEPVYLPLQVFGRLAGVVGYIEENNIVFNVPARETNLLLRVISATLKLSIPDLTTHVGRHTCGTLLAEMGYNTRQIGEVLGISEKTAAVYIKNTRQGLTNAFARFGGL